MVFIRIHVVLTVFSIGVGIVSLPSALAASLDRAKEVYILLNGYKPSTQSPVIPEMARLMDAGKEFEAADLATREIGFSNNTVREFASKMGTRAEVPNAPLNDFQAMVIGVTYEGRDARTLLSGNFTYLPLSEGGSASTFAALEKSGKHIAQAIRYSTPRVPALPDAAGLLTTEGWAEQHYVAGTNRRSVEYAFREFLCTPIAQIRDVTLPDFRVRRDIDRAPGGNARVFQTECRGCHAPMDAFGGAFAKFDYSATKGLIYVNEGVARKMNLHSNVYPDGFSTVDDSWINLATINHNAELGWNGPDFGRGASEFGALLANSNAFKTCMTKRVFEQVCRKAPSADVSKVLSQRFVESGFNLKNLFIDSAIHAECESRRR